MRAADADATLAGFASLPADTFEPPGGHRSGQFINEKQLNGRTTPFERQPIQGISAVVRGDEPGTFLALADNGYGAKANSADFLLSVYRVRPDFKTEQGGQVVGSGTVQIELAFRLSDPDKHVPWPIVADAETYPKSDIAVPPEFRDGRLLTGADFDPESMVRLPDGTFWIGDEFGPFLLHFDKDGKLLEPPVELPGEGMHSPDHPTKDPAKPKISTSGGFEAMSIVMEPKVDDDLKPIGEREFVGFACYLEKPFGRLGVPYFSFSPEGEPSFEQDAMAYSITPSAKAIGDACALQLAPRDPRLFAHLILERDDQQAAAASHKWLVRYDVWFDTRPGAVGPFDDVSWTLLANLLQLPDPHDLNGDGERAFRFPFLTPESVLPIDERTVLVINDNNYPFTSGRAPGEPDPTEFILIRFDKPLAELGPD